MDSTEQLLRQASASLCIRFSTDAPYSIGGITGEKVGFSQIPSVVCHVTCRDEDLSAVVPVVRQKVFGELAERGWGNEHVGVTPGTQQGRRRKFRDENESSESYGRNKFGTSYRFRFDMDTELARATFAGFGSFAQIPQKEGS